MKVTNLKQTINETIRLLSLKEYQTYKEVVVICRKQLGQARVLELMSMGENKDTIATGTGVNEKAVRFWRNGDHPPTIKHLVALEQFYRKVKRRYVKKSTRSHVSV